MKKQGEDMPNVISKKYNELRNDVYRDLYGTNRWVYVKLQSIFEYLCNEFTHQQRDVAMLEYSLLGKIEVIVRFYTLPKNFLSSFKIINQKANTIKHDYYYELKDVSYQQDLVEEAIENFNILCDKIFGSKGMLYHIDYQNHVNESSLILNSTEFFLEPQIASIVKSYQIVNPSIDDNSFQINTGVNRNDFGFVVFGIEPASYCKHKFSAVFAVIFNMMQRSRVLPRIVRILEIEKLDRTKKNFRNIYRYIIVLLLLIKNNYFTDHNDLPVATLEGNNNELTLALDIINFYAQMITNLMNIDYKPVSINEQNPFITISIASNKGSVFLVDKAKESNLREKYFWFENSIQYEVTSSIENDKSLLYFLQELFGFSDFKPGQKESLTSLLNRDKNSVVILPTGGGKSILYYFLALLQPKITLVISPTLILVKDQIRNLRELHNIDDAFNADDSYISKSQNEKIVILCGCRNTMLFITPEELMYKGIIEALQYLHKENKLSNIILDEVHTISNWSHNFRPEYLMLANTLNQYLSGSHYLGFTATADNRVLKDVITQLDIKEDNIIAPIELKRRNLTFEFYPCANEEDMSSLLSNYLENINFGHDHEKKAIIYTKSVEVSEILRSVFSSQLKFQMDIYKKNQLFSYEAFVEGRKNIILTQEELGIGINIPLVNFAIHYGVPLSKAQYVQELGRVDRFNEGGQSIVFFRNREELDDLEKSVLDFNTSISEIISTLKLMDKNNDIRLTFEKIIGHLEHYSVVAKGIRNLFLHLRKDKEFTRVSYVVSRDFTPTQQQVYLYFLNIMGIIDGWFIHEMNENSITYDVKVSKHIDNLDAVKSHSIKYIYHLGYYTDEIYLIENSNSISEIIFYVQSWYYKSFLKYHREQLLNMIDFFEINLKNSSSRFFLIKQLADYFSGQYIKKSSFDNMEIIDMSVQDMVKYIDDGQNTSVYSMLEREIENEYNSKLDFYICLYQLLESNHLNHSRLIRSLSNMNEKSYKDLLTNSHYIYSKISEDSTKLDFINCLLEFLPDKELLENIYLHVKPDLIYYGLLLERVNKIF